MVALRGRAVVAVVMCAAAVLAGCSSSPRTEATSTPSPPSAAEYDLARLGDVENHLPAGFTAYPFEAAPLDPAFVGQVGAVVSYGKPFSVNPSQCHALLKPVDGQLTARTNGIRADGPDKQSIAVNADAPVTVATGVPATGCDQMTFDVDDDAVRTFGAGERIAAPAIDGATTEALKIQFDGATAVQYSYSAILDDRLYVNVAARLDPNFDAQPLLPDLLVQAVAAVRRR
jgi:hypothetical protein